MLKIGLTGGIGSGKSTVSRIFSAMGAPVYDTDSAAKRLMNSSPELVARIESIFGEQAYVDGTLDRAYLASIVFSDKTLLRKLDALVHPAVVDDFLQWSAEKEAEGHLYIIHESAILFESGYSDKMDYVITVSSPVALRVERASLRDNSDPDKILARIENQMDDAGRESKSDYIIVNDESDLLVPQVAALDKLFRNESRR